MRIFEIKNEFLKSKTVGWLLYFDAGKRFYIELPEKSDPWETPILLSSFLKKGWHSIDSEWSEMWVRERIIPPDRQNLGQILRDNHMKAYDEFRMLLLTQGRCSQDDCYLSETAIDKIPEWLARRFSRKVKDVIPQSDHHMLVFFMNGETKQCALNEILSKDIAFSPVLENNALYLSVSIQPGGYGICWGRDLNVPDSKLYAVGKKVPLSYEDFIYFAKHKIVNTPETMERLGCTRQNVNDLVKRNRLNPIKVTGKNKMFLIHDVMELQER